jgi:SulP family sulfate permease
MRLMVEGLGRALGSSSVRIDLLAGLTVALVGLPQCLAYAMMSGVPPAYGLATAAVPGFVAAVAGRSAQVVTGPTNTTGLLILSALTPFLGANGLISDRALAPLATLTLLAGALRVAAALAGGASLLRFLPESVLVGFTAGAGILIATMQLDEALGLPAVPSAGLREEIAGLAALLQAGHSPALPAMAFTVSSLILLSLAPRLPRVPVALLAVVAGTLLAWGFGLDGRLGLPLVQDRSSVPTGWPQTALPALNPSLLGRFLVPGAAIALLGSLELAVTARANGARPDMRREILGQGVANLAGAFTGCFPASASLTRSALLRIGGAQTRLAAASAAVFVLPILLFAAPSVGLIPQASLAGVLLITAYRMIDRASMARMWRASAATRLLLVVTLAAALLLRLEWAILLGAALGLVIHLARTSRPRIRALGLEAGKLVPLSKSDAAELVVLEVSGDLHYAAVDPFVARVEELVPRSARTVILDLTHAHEIRFTALRAFEQLAEKLHGAGSELHLAGVSPELHELLTRSGSKLPATLEEPVPGSSVWKAVEAVGQRERDR